MTREKAKQLLPIIQAFSEGKEIEIKKGDGWVETTNPKFSCSPESYRIKPESKYIPFTYEDSHDSLCELVKKSHFTFVNVANNNHGLFRNDTHYTYPSALSDYFFRWV